MRSAIRFYATGVSHAVLLLMLEQNYLEGGYRPFDASSVENRDLGKPEVRAHASPHLVREVSVALSGRKGTTLVSKA